MHNERMDTVPDFNEILQIALTIRGEEKATLGTLALDKIALWHAMANPRRSTTPALALDDDSEGVRLLEIKDMKFEISFLTTPDDILFGFLQEAGNQTFNQRKRRLYKLKSLCFDNLMVGQWAMDR
jgi:DNA-dependent RNA polymerase auxiliary subunit epsilon